jgi:hypothetical protein
VAPGEPCALLPKGQKPALDFDLSPVAFRLAGPRGRCSKAVGTASGTSPIELVRPLVTGGGPA